MEFETPKILKSEIAGFQKVFIKKINQYLNSMPKVTATSTDREFSALDNYFYGFIWKDVIFHHDKLIERTKKLMRNNKLLAPLSQGRKKITDETPVNLKYRGFNIATYKGKGGVWIAEANHSNGTTFIVYSKPGEMKTAVEIAQEKIRNYLKK